MFYWTANVLKFLAKQAFDFMEIDNLLFTHT